MKTITALVCLSVVLCVGLYMYFENSRRMSESSRYTLVGAGTGCSYKIDHKTGRVWFIRAYHPEELVLTAAEGEEKKNGIEAAEKAEEEKRKIERDAKTEEIMRVLAG